MFAQDLVAKNEALRRLAHELQLKAEQQLKQKDSDAHGREQQMMKSYEDSLAAARQQNAVAMVGLACVTTTAVHTFIYVATKSKLSCRKLEFWFEP